MKWFRRWLTERSASRTSSEREIDRAKCENGTGSDRWTCELVDPEDFFDCPDHVKNYRDEKEFLKMMSEWEIIEDPKQFDNFFSADFEDELVTAKTTGPSQHSSEEESSHECEEMDETIPQKDYYDLLLGHKVSYGIPCTPRVLAQFRDSKNGHTSTSRDSGGTIPKNYLVNRKLSKSEALTRSIMGPIYKLPGCDSCDSDEPIEPSEKMDHYDIQQYFKLDDKGNILLDTSHIGEEKGYGFLMRKNKRVYRHIARGKAIDETYSVRKSVVDWIKALLQALRDIIFGHPRNKTTSGGPGESVRAYTLQLANDHTSTFSRNIENFISCTKESREAAPQVVMRNMRQFMNGMKNYLVKHGEGEFHQEVQKARSRLKSDEFLNLDAILEAVMHQLVVLPLREHLYGMFVDYYTRSGDIQLLVENVKYACARNALDFGIRPSVTPPSSAALRQISSLLERLQEAEMPLDKLELFLCVIAAIFDATGCPRGQQLGADDFLPILVYVVAKCGFVGAEIEAEFMWGLLQPALLSGEAGYYLTALCSAVHVLKSFMASENEGTGSLDWRSSSMPACSSVLRVIIPDECNGSLQTRTLPVRPHTTTREVCRIIAHKARITNPQDYGLFKLVDGEETLLADSECPQDARIAARGKHCILAYKRIDAKIAWPTATQPSFA